MIFIESQQVAGSVTERFHFAMNPFFHRFNNYVKFISSFKTCFTFKVTKDSDYVKRLIDNVEEVAKLGGQSIISGQDYPANHFTAKELDSICRTINDIWYCIDGKKNYIDKHLTFDSHHVSVYQLVATNFRDNFYFIPNLSIGYKGRFYSISIIFPGIRCQGRKKLIIQ